MLYRSFYALPKSIRGVDDIAVNALLGSVNTILFEVERRPVRAVALCFGDDAARYRVDLYPPYHADRPPVPDELAPQWERAPALYEALGWWTFDQPGLEADDLLGSLALEEAVAGGETLILTGDRDLFQCAGERCSVLYMRSGSKGAELVDAEAVQKRYGVSPQLVPDFIALRGDPSDGLPGAKGIGEKTAAELLRRHGSLEQVIAGALGERPSLRLALRADPDLLRSFKEIATLRRVAIDRPGDHQTDRTRGAEAARALGMKRLAKRLEEPAAGPRRG